MLRFDVRELRQGAVPVTAAVAPGDPVFHGLTADLLGPVEVSGEVQAASRNAFLWRGGVRGAARVECRRCLAPIEAEFEVAVQALFSPDPESQDDPSVYPLAEPVSAVDLSEAVREEVVLAVPQFALCREDCAGLCPHCGYDLNQGPCGCGAPEPR